MKKPGHLFRWTTITLFCLGVFLSTDLQGKNQSTGQGQGEQRADIIIIDGMTSWGELEKPSVEFPHDAHTEALAIEKISCDKCHLKKNESFFPKFKRLEDKDRVEVMNIYHDNCIGCHGEMRLQGKKTGPIECDDCHREQKLYVSSRQPVGFDNSLHYRHVEVHEKKCEQCHHEYDEKTKKLFHAKEKEGTCRYCHKEETQENRLSMRISSHIACINCHLKNQEKNPLNLPVKCSQCHAPSAWQKIKKLDPVPRLERKQPDMVMIKTGDEELDAVGKNRMNLVPFNHKAHEGYNNTCRVCHHQEMKKCNECHTLGGSDAGKGVNLELAMHKKDTDHSCVGCHAQQYKKNKDCAGCHQFTPATARMSNRSCEVCHIPLPEGVELNDKTAQLLLDGRPQKPDTYRQEEIPEKIVIDKLSKKYEAVDFPHRKIVNSIVEKMGDNKLAAHFHAEKATVCSGCHHNGPLTKQPSGCASCHTKAFNDKDMHKPGIVGAYHIQCMECHATMKIDKVGCVDCHKEKSPQLSSPRNKGKE
ncbi:MAG: sulfate respiration complex hexadecaheme cytochrome HmcA [Thermodesulfobacteriota bacterium]